MAAFIASTTHSAWSRMPIPTHRTVRIFRPCGSIPGRPIVTIRFIDFLRPERHRMTDDRIEQVGTTILGQQHCHLGEGCTYDRGTDTARWFDILERTLFQADLASGAVTAHALPVMASVLAFIDDA